MRHRARVGLVVLLGALGMAAAARAEDPGQRLAEGAGRPLIGAPAPALLLKTIDGATIDLGKLYGHKAVYLKFWATWCVPCREQMPHFEHSFEDAGPDLVVIAVNAGFTDSVDDVRAYRRELGLKMPIVFDDGTVGAAFKLRVTPQHVVIGRDGRIQYVGHLVDARLESALAAARGPGAAGSTAVAAAPATPPRYRVGDRLPAESPATIGGAPFSLRDATGGRRTVLVFLSPWCESYLAVSRPVASADCRRIREQVAAATTTPGVRWLGIASGLWATAEDVRQYQDKYHVRIPLALDESGDLYRAFGVTRVPAVVVADPDGRILHRVDAADLRTPSALADAIGGT